MSKKELTKVSKLLLTLAALNDVLSPVLSVRELRKRALYGNSKSLNTTIYKLRKRGWIKVVDKNAERFLQLTKQGQLEVLIAKAHMPTPSEWDGKWRVLIFDIPEEHSDKRQLLRNLLKSNNFNQLQASVYISPYPLNRDAIKYLQTSRLKSYIRIFKVEEMDDDSDLCKKFNLKH